MDILFVNSNTPSWKIQSSNWWFGIKNADNDDIRRMMKIDHASVNYIVFRKVTSTKNNKPFIEGLVKFEKVMTHREVKKILRCSYAKNSIAIEGGIESFKDGDCFEVDVKAKRDATVRGVIKASVRGGLAAISRFADSVAEYIK